jgi:hypothetical protein
MADEKRLSVLKIVNTILFLIMVAVNILANVLPLNGLNTGEVSNLYPNLFTPAGITFSIWGLIYLLLACFVLYQFGAFKGNESTYRNDLIQEIGPYFAISSLANAAWIFAWHYRMVGVSVVLIFIILYCLAVIVSQISKYDLLPVKEKILVKIPFSIYFGWITVATIANIVAFLVSIGWNGWGIPQQTWTAIILLVGVAITGLIMLKNKDIAYGLAVIWAYAGILYKHLSQAGFHGQYPAVIWAVIISLVLLVCTVGYLIVLKKREYA